MKDLSGPATTGHAFLNNTREIGGSDSELSVRSAVATPNANKQQLGHLVRVFVTNPFCCG